MKHLYMNNFSKNESNINATVKVTENKAPTDESIRLLNEFQEKAEKNIIDKFNIQDNVIHGAMVTWLPEITPDKRYLLKFTLNGKEYYLDGELKGEIFLDRYEVMKLLHKSISELIASKLLENVTKENMKIGTVKCSE